MSVQIATHSLSRVNTQVIQPYYHLATSDSSLDPITSQILKTKDAALEVMHRFENGAANRFWEEQKKWPSVTWLGDLVDRFLGWGRYHPENEHKESTAREAGHRREEKRRSFISNESGQEANCTTLQTAEMNITTSFDALKYPNNSCVYLSPDEYFVGVYKWLARDPKGPDDIICRVDRCVREFLQSCQPMCLPCSGATDQEKNATLNLTYSEIYFPARVEELQFSLLWEVAVRYKDNLNIWKYDQIVNLVNSTLLKCENEAVQKRGDIMPWVIFLTTTLILGGGLGIYVFIYKKK